MEINIKKRDYDSINDSVNDNVNDNNVNDSVNQQIVKKIKDNEMMISNVFIMECFTMYEKVLKKMLDLNVKSRTITYLLKMMEMKSQSICKGRMSHEDLCQLLFDAAFRWMKNIDQNKKIPKLSSIECDIPKEIILQYAIFDVNHPLTSTIIKKVNPTKQNRLKVKMIEQYKRDFVDDFSILNEDESSIQKIKQSIIHPFVMHFITPYSI
jgi:hypothetical protein